MRPHTAGAHDDDGWHATNHPVPSTQSICDTDLSNHAVSVKCKQQKLIGHHKWHATPAPIGNIVYEIDDGDSRNNYASNIDYDEPSKKADRFDQFDDGDGSDDSNASERTNDDGNEVTDDSARDEMQFSNRRHIFKTASDKSDKSDKSDSDDNENVDATNNAGGDKEGVDDTAVADNDGNASNKDDGDVGDRTDNSDGMLNTNNNENGNGNNKDEDNNNNSKNKNNDIVNDRTVQMNEKQERQRYPIGYPSATGNLKQRPTEMTHKNWGKWKIEISFA